MKQNIRRKLNGIAVAAVGVSLIAGTCGTAYAAESLVEPISTAAEATTDSEEDAIWAEVREAFIYFLPLVLMDNTKNVSTNTETIENGRAPVNQLGHGKTLATAQFTQVVTPNVDTVYSQLFYDLSEDALVLTSPETDRYNAFQIMNAWSDTVAVVGTGGDMPDAGSYLLTGPNFDGEVPEGMTEIKIPTAIGWIIGRTVCNGQDDLDNVYAIQEQMDARPLSYYLSGEELPKGTYDEALDGVPIDLTMDMTPKGFFDRASSLLEENPGYPEDAETLAGFEELGIGVGQTFDPSILGEDAEEKWRAMEVNLVPTLTESSQQYLVRNGIFNFLGNPISHFGTEYDYRGIVAISGFGANPVDVAVYMKSAWDDTGAELDGAHSYVIHFDADQLPPVKEKGFWSITAYGDDDFLIDNPIDRYAINDRSDYKMNDDGSLDILLSANAPEGDDSNWLPTGDSGFHIVMRIYLPEESVQDGTWTAPTITMLES